jgi:ankyrin repeat protein
MTPNRTDRLRSIAPALLALLASCIAGAAASPADDLYNAIRTNDLARLRALVGTKADANAADERGATPLMYAAVAGSLDAMRFLIEKGADVNAHNNLGATALIWSATDLAKVRLLVEHGADVNAATARGRTALLIAAMSDNSASIVRLLLEKGANAKALDRFKTTTLRGAALGNDTATIRQLIDVGVDVNAGDFPGFTPLMFTAGWNGNVRATKLLLDKGAKVDAVTLPVLGLPEKNGPSKFGLLTPLILAAPFGPPELIQTLIDAGANVNAKDVRKMTPLMLAVATDHQDPAVIKMMVAHGADPAVKSDAGESAIDWSLRAGSRQGAQLLKAGPAAEIAAFKPSVDPPSVRTAVERTVTLIEKASGQFFAASGCVSCHAQSMTDITVGEARLKKIPVDAVALQQRSQMVRAMYPPEPLLERMDAAGAMEQIAYPLVGFSMTGYAPDRYTDGMVANVAAQQSADGKWHVGAAARPPAEEGDIFRTAVCLRALKAYAPPGRASEMDARIANARKWLESAHAVTAEDRAMQVLGLHWAGVPAGSLTRFAKAILGQQQPDGGWRQVDALTTDAYATGESLYALAKAGVPPTDAAYRKGVKYLLGSQHADGSWFVASRSPRIQAYFEGGFPYGHDQWVSQWGTSWAALALIEALDGPVTRAAR